MVILRFPTNRIFITQTYYYIDANNKHMGVDNGYSPTIPEFGPTQPIYAMGDGTVVEVVDNDKTGKSWGNLVKIQHDKETYTLVSHLSNGVKVKKGDIVKQGQQIGNMGHTGKATGPHVHFEVYKGGASTKYRVDPLEYTYVFPDQEVSNDSKAKDKLKYINDINPFKEGDYVYVKEDIKLYTTIEYKETKYTLKQGEKAYVRYTKDNNVALANPITHEYFPSAWTNELSKLTKDDPTDYKKLYEEEKALNNELQNRINKAIEVLNG